MAEANNNNQGEAYLKEVNARLDCQIKCNQFTELILVIKRLRKSNEEKERMGLMHALNHMLVSGYSLTHEDHATYKRDWCGGVEVCKFDENLLGDFDGMKLMAPHVNIFTFFEHKDDPKRNFIVNALFWSKDPERIDFLVAEWKKHNGSFELSQFDLASYWWCDSFFNDFVKTMITKGFYVTSDDSALCVHYKANKEKGHEMLDLLRSTIKTAANIAKK